MLARLFFIEYILGDIDGQIITIVYFYELTNHYEGNQFCEMVLMT